LISVSAIKNYAHGIRAYKKNFSKEIFSPNHNGDTTMNQRNSEIRRLTELYAQGAEQILADYFNYLRFKSISSELEFKSEVLDCALWVKNYLEESQFNVELWEGQGHPVVFAENQNAGANKPTILFYGHYDVQPVDPLELWESPPFEPVIKDGNVFARGAQDNKGQSMYVMSALRTLIKETGKLPVNVKLCIEGEEECGSFTLLDKLKGQKEKLKADFMAIVDLGASSEERPAIPLGLRGITTMTLEITGSGADLHSGVHGGIVYNPNHALVEILAKLRDASGRITVPGFYDDVTDLDEDVRSRLSTDFDPKAYEETFGAKPTGGERAYSATESGSIRPTLEINGLAGGYAGEGFKTVIPAKALAKVSCRLVPDQDPDKIWKQVTAYIKELVPEGLTVSFPGHPEGGQPFRSDHNSPIVKAVAKAYEEITGVQAGYDMQGGSVPVVTSLVETTGAQTVLMGWGLDDDNIHAPNEFFGLQRFKKGFLSIARLLEIIGQTP